MGEKKISQREQHTHSDLMGGRNTHQEEPGKIYIKILTLIVSGCKLQLILAFLLLSPKFFF